jgi:hypothetical protein
VLDLVDIESGIILFVRVDESRLFDIEFARCTIVVDSTARYRSC